MSIIEAAAAMKQEQEALQGTTADSLIGSDNSVGDWGEIVSGSVGEMRYYKAIKLYKETYGQ